MNKPGIFLLKRVSALYLLVPSFLFAWGWLRQPYASINLIILIFLGFWLVRGIYQASRALPRPGKTEKLTVVAILAVILLWALFSGVGGFGFQNEDYIASNALLKDLVIQDWPISMQFKDSDWPVVYYMAYYLPAAGIGKLLGWNAANIFLLVWTMVGLWLSFAWFAVIAKVNLGNKTKGLLALLVLFCLAGGLDLFGHLILDGRPFKLHTHIEWWAKWFQYSSFTTLLYWVPQHAIAAWLVTGIVVQAFMDGDEIDTLGIGLAASAIWSPFGMVGIAPFFVVMLLSYLLSSKRRGLLFRKESLILNGLSIWLIGFHLVFIFSSRFSFPADFIWNSVKNPALLPRYVSVFWALEFGLLTGMIVLFLLLGIAISAKSLQWSTWKDWKKWLWSEFTITPGQVAALLLCLLILIILPMFKVGKYNDIVTRGSMPALFVFWAFTGKVIIDASPAVKKKLAIIYAIMLLTVLAGFYPAISETARSIKYYTFEVPEFSQVLTTTELDDRDKLQRMGNKDAFFYQYLSKIRFP